MTSGHGEAVADPVLSVSNLTTCFETIHGNFRAVDDVSFEIPAGATLGVVGESGSGKSVTFLSIMGLVPTPPGRVISGSAFFAGSDLLSLSDRRMRRVRGRQIAMIFQDPLTALNPAFTVGEQIGELVRVHHGASRREARLRALEVLDLVHIPQAWTRLDSYPHEFSGGMRQRVTIAMALALRPRLLIADEPTTALDVTIQAQVLELLESLRQELDMTVVLITHDLGVVARYAHEVMVMYAGRVVERGSAEALFRAPAHPYTAALLESTPRWDQRRVDGQFTTIPGQPPKAGEALPACAFQPRCSLAHGRAKCSATRPELSAVDSAGHTAACHFSQELSSVPVVDGTEDVHG